MLNTIVAFVGAFAALLVLQEIQFQNKLIRYVAALLAGALLTVVLGMVLRWAAHALGAAV